MNTSLSDSTICKKLTGIIQAEPFGIRAAVAQEALDYTSDQRVNFFADLLQFGCQCGMISSLVYYWDTAEFFDKHYQEIEELRMEFEENTGEPFRVESDLKNTLAWFAFEEIAFQMAQELGLEI